MTESDRNDRTARETSPDDAGAVTSDETGAEPLEKQIEEARRRGEDDTPLLKRLVFRVIDEVRAGLVDEVPSSTDEERTEGPRRDQS